LLADPTTGAHTRSKELLVLVNGNASASSDGEHLLAEVLGHVSQAGRAVGRITPSEAELLEALDGAAGRRVVLVGGDGTLHAALNVGVTLPELALVPAGRANNVARALGVPPDVALAARVAATAPARPVDVLRVESGAGTVYCVEAVSGGIQADARSRYTGENSADLRAGAQVFAQALRGYRPYRVDLALDGRPGFVGEAAQVFLSNLPLFGFGFKVDPVARPADGLLEAIVIEARTRTRVARLLASAYRGTHLKREGVTLRRAREVLIRSSLPIVGDARPLGTGPASVTVEQGRLRIAS
jgi:diacylglycerol kinase (ATP)